MTRLDKIIQTALIQLKNFEPKDGYYVAFSGGKDSCVIYDLVKRANVKFDVHHSITTIDPPEMMKWMKKAYPEVQRHKPEMSMFELVTYKKSLPTRIGRFCCEYLKESGGSGRVTILGIRSEESNNRADRKLFEYWNNKAMFNLIVDWTEKDVWNYIDERNVPYSPMYDNGTSRIGCIGCPLIGGKRMKREFAKYPHIKKGYLRAIKKAMENDGFKRFETPEDVFEWWTSDESITNYIESKNQAELF